MRLGSNFIGTFWLSLMLITSVFAAGNQPPAVSGVLPDIVLAVPKSPAMQHYLGITGKENFRIPEIKARVVIIEIFNVY